MDETRALELLKKYDLTHLLPAVLDGDLTLREYLGLFDERGPLEDEGGSVFRRPDKATVHIRSRLVIYTCWYPERRQAA